MGDMGELCRELKEHRQTHRQARMTQAASMVNDIRAKVDSLTVDDNGTWNIIKGNCKAQFYPTKGTWQANGRMYHGGIFQFVNWLERQ